MGTITEPYKIVTLFDELCSQLDIHSPGEGLSQMDVLSLPDPLAALLNYLVRQGEVTAAHIAADFNLTEAESEQVIQLLLQKKLVTTEPNPVTAQPAFKVHLAPKRPRRAQTDVWKALDF